MIKKLKKIICLFATTLMISLPLFSDMVIAEELFITPTSPLVEPNGACSLSVTHAVGNVIWTSSKGIIDKKGCSIGYTAPGETGIDVVTALDDAGNHGTISIKIMDTSDIENVFHTDNANWELFTNRSEATAILISEDRQTVWVGTQGGLEKRDAKTQTLERIYTHQSGLPDNRIKSIIPDNQGGIWVATLGGLCRVKSDDSIETFTKTNSALPENSIFALYCDNQGDLWIGMESKGLGHLNSDSTWEFFHTNNSELPSNRITAIAPADQGGFWVGTEREGIVHIPSDGTWEIYNTASPDLPDNEISALVPDGQGGVWIGGAGYYSGGGLAHLMSDGTWKFFLSEKSHVENQDRLNIQDLNLPDHHITVLLSDTPQGLWIGTRQGGLAYLNSNGTCERFNTDNAPLPSDHVTALHADDQGGLWVGTAKGFGYLSSDNIWDVNKSENGSALPHNAVKSLISDHQGGIWVGTWAGLTHLKSDKAWEIFSTGNSGLPDNMINALILDDLGELWVGTGSGSSSGGLALFKSDGSWTSFNKGNSVLPDNWITALASDNQGGLWVGTPKGIAHRKNDGIWEVPDLPGSDLLRGWVTALIIDDDGGLWLGMGYNEEVRLLHLKSDGSGEMFTHENSPLWAYADINALLPDGSGGIWVGTWGGGLAHLKSDGTWEVLGAVDLSNQQNDDQQNGSDNANAALGLPSNYVISLLSDGHGGIWVGTEDGGMGHMKSDGSWELSNVKNSDLPTNWVTSIIADDQGQGGLWVGTGGGVEGGGLAHLTYCHVETEEESYLTDNRAAIIIAGGGNTSDNALWDSTEKISNYIYKMLNRRGFSNSNICYLSPKSWADFNGDGIDDNIVDGPNPSRQLTVDDVREAIEWAKSIGELNQPLYLFFTDHGGHDRLQLSKGVYLESSEIKSMLDCYQQESGNPVICVIDACHSGTLLSSLAGPNRAIISSTDEGLAYFDRYDYQSFIYFFTKGLYKGLSFTEAFYYAESEQTDLLGKLSNYAVVAGDTTGGFAQHPQFDDTGDGTYTIQSEGEWLKNISINGGFSPGDVTLQVTPLTASGIVTEGEAVTLKAQATLSSGYIERVWAVIRPPKMDILLDATGTPLLSFPKANLIRSASDEEENLWQGSWNGFVYNGAYEITFYAEDNDQTIESSDTVHLTVEGALACPENGGLRLNLFAEDQTLYRPGDLLRLSMIEDLGYGYDLYLVLFLPDGRFSTMQRPLTDAAQLNRFNTLSLGDRWMEADRKTGQATTLIDVALPHRDLPAGAYCLYGAMVPEGTNLIDSITKGNYLLDWISFGITGISEN